MFYNDIGAMEALRVCESQTEAYLENIDFEFTTFVACTETAQIVLENQVAEKKSFVERIKAFFKNIFTIFKEKLAKLSGANDRWLKDNKELILGLNFDKMKISCKPYWNSSLQDITNAVKSGLNIMDDVKSEVDDAAIRDAFMEKMIPGSKQYDLQIILNYFRFGLKNAEVPDDVEIGGSKLSSIVRSDMYPFASTYSSKAVPAINGLMKEGERIISGIEAKSASIKESYSILYDAPISHTDLASVFVIKEESNAEATKTDSNDTKEDSKAEDNKKEKDDDSKSVKNVEVKNEEDEKLKGKSKGELKYMKECVMFSQSLLTSALTVIEEMYTVYVKALKALVSSSGERVEKESKEVKETGKVKNMNAIDKLRNKIEK